MMYRSGGGLHLSATLNLTEQRRTDSMEKALAAAILDIAAKDYQRTPPKAEVPEGMVITPETVIQDVLGGGMAALFDAMDTPLTVAELQEAFLVRRLGLEEDEARRRIAEYVPPKKETVRTCHCGRPITRRAKECRACYIAASTVRLVCHTCGKEFTQKHWKAALYEHHFCSKRCQRVYATACADKCIVCNRFCSEYDNDGNCVHHLCKVDRDALQSESRGER